MRSACVQAMRSSKRTSQARRVFANQAQGFKQASKIQMHAGTLPPQKAAVDVSVMHMMPQVRKTLARHIKHVTVKSH